MPRFRPKELFTMSAAAPATATSDTPVPAKGKKKLIIIIAIVLLLVLAGGGAAAYFVMKQRAAAVAAEEGGDEAAPAAHTSASKDPHRAAPVFVALDPFVVNLADKDAERYAQIGLTLEVDDAKFAEEMKIYMPAIRNSILMILAHKNSSELLERAGKEALAAEIMRESVRPMGIEIDPPADAGGADHATPGEAGAKPKPGRPAVHNPVRRVHFASFIVQ
jgi:flagellar FliL protein